LQQTQESTTLERLPDYIGKQQSLQK